MKLLQVVDQLNQGGTERVAVDLTILLSKEVNVDVSFFCLLSLSDLDEELRQHSVKLSYLNRKNKYNPKKLFELFKKFNKYDIIHIHSRQVLRYVGLLFFLPLKRNFKVVFQDHYGNIEINKNISPYTKFCIRKIDSYIGVSQSLVSWVKEYQLQKRVYLLTNIIRVQNSTFELNKCGDIIIIGNFRPQKNYEFLCKLISELPNSISVDLYGNFVDEVYYQKIKNLAIELNLTSRLNFINGKTNVSQFLNNYKLAIHCAPSETGPLVAIEYLSKGIPFVMFDTGEVARVMRKYSENSILKNFDINTWVSTIIKLLNNQEYKDEVVKLNNQIFDDHYSEKKYIEKCLIIYRDIQNS